MASRVPYYVQHLYEDHVYRDPATIGGKAVPLEDRCMHSLHCVLDCMRTAGDERVESMQRQRNSICRWHDCYLS